MFLINKLHHKSISSSMRNTRIMKNLITVILDSEISLTEVVSNLGKLTSICSKVALSLNSLLTKQLILLSNIWAISLANSNLVKKPKKELKLDTVVAGEDLPHKDAIKGKTKENPNLSHMVGEDLAKIDANGQKREPLWFHSQMKFLKGNLEEFWWSMLRSRIKLNGLGREDAFWFKWIVMVQVLSR